MISSNSEEFSNEENDLTSESETDGIHPPDFSDDWLQKSTDDVENSCKIENALRIYSLGNIFDFDLSRNNE